MDPKVKGKVTDEK
jgi:hypothetical protein